MIRFAHITTRGALAATIVGAVVASIPVNRVGAQGTGTAPSSPSSPPAGPQSHGQIAAATSSTPAAADRWATYRKPSEDALRRALTPLQFSVTQRDATERPFANTYWDNHGAGIYVDVVSGEPLFSSLDKYESNTGWPSFTKALEPGNVRTKTDRSLFETRTEVRSAHADSHLGHLFNDGPPPTGERYCMNSAALRFVPADSLATLGYGKYGGLFKR